jgi:DNA-binding beta-propeller fold protein YncE
VAAIALAAAVSVLANGAPALAQTSWAQPGEVAVSPDGRHAYAADYRNVLAMERNPVTGSLSLIDWYESGGKAIEISPDGRFLYAANGNFGSLGLKVMNIFERDPATGRLTLRGTVFEGRGEWEDVAITADGRHLYATDRGRGAVVLFDRNRDTGALTRRSEVPAACCAAIGLAPDQRHLYVPGPGNDGLVALYERSENGDLTARDPGCACGAPNLFSPDGTRAYEGSTTYDRDTDTGRLTKRQHTEVPGSPAGDGPAAYTTHPFDVRLTPDGRSLYVLDPYGVIHQLRASEPGLDYVHTYRDGEEGIFGIAHAVTISLSPDGEYMYVGTATGANPSAPGQIVVLRIAPTGDLSYASTFTGTVVDSASYRGPRRPSVTINGGQPYTNDPEVELQVSGLSGSTYEVDISNDGGFAHPERRAVTPDGHFRWRLASTGPERLPKTVYVRPVYEEARYLGITVNDDIVLDETVPVVVAAAADRRTLHVSARDRASGVKQLQVASDRRRPGEWRRFVKRSSFKANGRQLFVRVRDGAGNSSHWRRVVRSGP